MSNAWLYEHDSAFLHELYIQLWMLFEHVDVMFIWYTIADSELSVDEDVYEEDEETLSKFTEVYSDTESEEEVDDEEE